MNKLTIQINNLEALERLIGGNSEVEIEVRNSVIQKFSEKHLKPLANCEPITSTLKTIAEAIKIQVIEKCSKEIATFQQSWSGGINDIKLRPEIMSEIDRQVRVLTDKNIQDAVDKSVKFWVNDAELKERINKKFEYYTTDHINNEIKKRIEKLKEQI